MTQNKIKFRRLEEALGQNELREYLSHKEETVSLQSSLNVSPELCDYKKPKRDSLQTLLIAPPITIPKDMQKRCIPPLGLSYIAASLEAVDYKVTMLDCTVEGYDQEQCDGNLMTYGLSLECIRKRLKSMDPPDVVGMSVLFSTDLKNLFNVARVVKDIFPDTVLIIGGLHPTIYPKEIFDMHLKHNNSKRTIDWVIRGEGEYRLVDFLNNYQQGKVDRNADGLVGFIDGEFILNHQRSVIEDLNALPYPAYHLLPMEKYFEINVPFSPVPQGNRVAQILASRGCPIGCSFCASTNMYKRYRLRSVDNIIGEIEELKKHYAIDEIQFADDNLTFNRNHSMEFFKALVHQSLIWCTPNGTMINSLTPELMELMAQSGLYQITLSLDSGNAKTLKNLQHKPVNLNSIPGLIAKAKEFGIFTHGTIVVGLPGETIEDIQEGFEFIKENLELTSISTFIAAAIPGSELYHQALEKGIITKEDALKIDTTKCRMYLTDINPEVLEKMVMNFQQEYTELAKNRDPEEYQRKYGKLIDRGKLQGAYGGRLT